MSSLSKNIYFLKVTSVPNWPSLDAVPIVLQNHWINKHHHLDLRNTPHQSYLEKGALHAEFGKIICLSIGYYPKNNPNSEIRIKTFSSDNETELLTQFFQTIERLEKTSFQLCAHNGKTYDYPFICRRALINAIPIPNSLLLQQCKSWNHPHLDTMDMWQFGDYKNKTSLQMIAAALQIEHQTYSLEELQLNYAQKNMTAIKDNSQAYIRLLSKVYFRLNFFSTKRKIPLTIKKGSLSK